MNEKVCEDTEIFSDVAEAQVRGVATLHGHKGMEISVSIIKYGYKSYRCECSMAPFKKKKLELQIISLKLRFQETPNDDAQ